MQHGTQNRSDPNWAKQVAAVRSGKYGKLLISYRLGKEVPFYQETKAFGDDNAAYESLDSMKQHLVDRAKLKLEDSTYQLGRKLKFDAKAEKFVGDEEADKLLTRSYRKPFVVLENI